MIIVNSNKFLVACINNMEDYVKIEYPESKLHPKQQIVYARLLAKRINKGEKIFLLTSSDFIIRELNNLILLNEDFKGKKDIMKRYKYSKKMTIDPSKIIVYDYNNGLDECEFCGEGYIVKSLDLVIEDLNKRSDDIYYSKKS